MRRRGDRRCWLSEPRVCFDGERRSFRDRLSQCCRGCRHFHRIIERSTGRRISEHVFCDTLHKVLEEMGGYNSELVEINQSLKQKIRSLSILDQVSKALQSTLDQDQIFHIILTGVTAAEILSLNRAFLFLVDEQGGRLAGKLAVGPTGPDDAGRIWDELQRSPRSFSDLALTPHDQVRGNAHVAELVRRYRVALDDPSDILSRAAREQRSFLVADAAADPATAGVGAHFGVGAFAVVPLVADGETLGLLMADNIITGLPVTEADLVLMGIFAGQAASSVKNARLYARLQEKIRELADSQEHLLKAERMAAIGEIAATLAHEIRTPLVSIGGYVNAMIGRREQAEPFREQLTVIRCEIERLEGVLSDTLEVARFKDPVLARADIAAVVGSCVRLLRQECRDKGIAVELDVAPSLPPVWLDMQQFPQVLLNVIKNAIHAMPDGGTVSLRARLTAGGIELAVADTGTGIPPDALGRIFEPRFTTSKHGLGIGLAVSKKIVEGHRGTIRAVPGEGRGTTFIINIPVRQ